MSIEAMVAVTVSGLVFLGRDYLLLPGLGCKRSPIQEKVNQLAKKMEVETPIRVAENYLFPWAAHGTEFYGKGVITVPSEITEGADCVTAIMAHELSHIKHNDGFWLATIVIITTVALLILSPFNFSIVTNNLIHSFILLACISYYSTTREELADDEALVYLNHKEKKALADFFETHRQNNLKWRNEEDLPLWQTILRKCIVSPDGDSLRGLFSHPTLISRIQKIEKSLN